MAKIEIDKSKLNVNVVLSDINARIEEFEFMSKTDKSLVVRMCSKKLNGDINNNSEISKLQDKLILQVNNYNEDINKLRNKVIDNEIIKLSKMININIKDKRNSITKNNLNDVAKDNLNE